MEYEKIKPYIEKGLISEQRHPEHEDLAIFNYTQKQQFAGEWDDITRQCRGLILNIRTGEVIARPFEKFFNYGEHVAKEWPIPDEEPKIFEKLDGSLGILYFLGGKPWIATRGSFTSDQAIWATEWWRQNIGESLGFDGDYTHLFEIIYPQNRIVVNYDFSGLVYLASIRKSTGSTIKAKLEDFEEPPRCAKEIPFMAFAELERMDEPNSEGFVLFYPKANVRMKIKFPEYVRLHKLITGVSEIAIWEHMKEGKTLDDLLEKVPDEFFKWVTETQRALGKQFEDIRFYVNEFFGHHGLEFFTMNRKDIAAVITKQKYPGLLFARLDDKDIEPMIWRMIRPHGKQSFKVDIDS